MYAKKLIELVEKDCLTGAAVMVYRDRPFPGSPELAFLTGTLGDLVHTAAYLAVGAENARLADLNNEGGEDRYQAVADGYGGHIGIIDYVTSYAPMVIMLARKVREDTPDSEEWGGCFDYEVTEVLGASIYEAAASEEELDVEREALRLMAQMLHD